MAAEIPKAVRDRLEELGVEGVRLILLHPRGSGIGQGASVNIGLPPLECPDRGTVERWLREKERQAEARAATVERLTHRNTWAAIVAAGAALLALAAAVVQIMLAWPK